jgi:hypothetical protein
MIGSGLDGASRGAYRPGIAKVVSPMTREVLKSSSAWGMLLRKAGALSLTTSKVSIAGMKTTFEGSSVESAIASKASASLIGINREVFGPKESDEVRGNGGPRA